MSYQSYLQSKQYASSTIKHYKSVVAHFTAWVKTQGRVEAYQVRQKDLLNYISYQKGKGVTVSTQNNILIALRSYYAYLKKQKYIHTNPAKNLHIKGGRREITIHPLSHQELLHLYHEYSKPKTYYREVQQRHVQERNTVIIGLMISQGIHSGELCRIQRKEVNMPQGTITIPGSKKSNPRTLALEAYQIISMHQYVTNLPDTQELLFMCNPYDTTQQIIKELKKINPILQNARHIRSSVIIHWLSKYDKREVQYRAGHKYISSVEHYERQELTELTSLLEQHHPLK